MRLTAVPSSGNLQQVLLVGRNQHRKFATRLSNLYFRVFGYDADFYTGLFDDTSFTLLLMQGCVVYVAMTCQIAMTCTGLPILYVSLLAANSDADVAAVPFSPEFLRLQQCLGHLCALMSSRP